MAGPFDVSAEYLDQIAQQGFSGTTGVSSTAAALTAALCLFNPANSGKSLFVYSIRFFGGNGAALHSLTTSNTNLALGTNASVQSNMLQSGLTSVAICTYKVSATVGIVGNTIDAYAQGNGIQFNQAPGNQGDGYLLPAGIAASLNLFVVCGGAGPIAMTMKWREFSLSI